ncbi:MAG: class II aldolase/adducin family protein [Clostridia bacterium]|nr:class II aldolase/adducin family protein [Clostridia bacterium]
MNLDMLHPADQIVLLMNRIYDHGMTTASGTDLSVRDAEGTVWISPDGVDKGNLRREDVAQIKADGSIAGMHRPSAEYPLHLAIYRKRPDIRAVLHARPSTLIACDLMGILPDLSILPRIAENARYVSAVPYEIPGSSALGARISAAFAKGADAVVPERHGVVIGAPTLPGAFRSLEALCLCSLIQRNAKIIGGEVRRVSDGDMRKIAENPVYTMPEFTPALRSSEELSARRELCKLIGRAYDKQLITSGNGSFSCRLSDGSLLITPVSKDRQSLKAEDFVLISDGKRESGKIPCPTVNRHLAIYANDPDIGSIMEAIPPFGMAFAVTARVPDLRLLPETYISLRDVRIYPTLTDDGTLARDMTLRSPAAMIENDCVLTVGASLLGAFNQLELLENGAKILTEALAFGGTPRGIDAEAFMELEQAFNL